MRADRVEVRGTVTPGDASVRVAGEDAQVSGGEFIAEVELQPGGNVIDVTATAPGRRPATEAVRVRARHARAVPTSSARTSSKAIETLKAAGLDAPRSAAAAGSTACCRATISVCAISPAGGTLVEQGTRVVLQTAREC